MIIQPTHQKTSLYHCFYGCFSKQKKTPEVLQRGRESTKDNMDYLYLEEPILHVLATQAYLLH